MFKDRQPLILGVYVSGLILSILSVGLRFLARIRYGAGLWWDDWVILVALVLLWSLNVDDLDNLAFSAILMQRP